ncbi:MAG: hypothetical protein V4508_15660 [Pseudomonadota bacterium]
MNAPRELDTSAIDERHPWLGLASFSEETRGFFYGREEEVGELSRRIQRKLLTVLFGQSGLGKTSILRAGIVPRLRAQGYCPVYVRVDYGPDAPAAAVQIKQAILQATATLGTWSQSGIAAEGESLWEFLHHRDDVLTDEHGKPIIPLLIFDQFEEIFTLAQADDDGRNRAAAFIEALSELVENRPSAALEARLEEDDTAVERFDFARSDYRVLIALREDYLAHLESLKGGMPSITQNRMRLAPMTGQQALAAVRGPGGTLVSDEVAEAIVRFVAGGSELAHAQVEPSLLSLICRELNDKRIASERDTITLDLLAGSHASILSDFYERALADQPEAVRSVIEDVLLTDSGYRENVAQERVLAALAAAGATPDALAALVDRRLLRIEDRLDIRRVELTHDVLCGVVRASRERRTEREALEANARLLEAQQQRERATRRSLVRARSVAVGCSLLTIVAVGASLYAYRISQRAEQARTQSERLMLYLSDDFARELDGAGDLEVVASFAKRTVSYYDGLPQNSPGSDTERNRAVAMIGYAETLGNLDNARVAEASTVLVEALGVLETRVKNGDASEATLVALGRGLAAQCRVIAVSGDTKKAIEVCQRAVKIIHPLIDGPSPSITARRSYGAVLTYMGTLQTITSDLVNGDASMATAKAAFASIGALELSDLPASIGYASASAWQTTLLVRLGRYPEAVRTGDEAYALITKVLELRPGHLRALRTLGYVSEGRANAASDAMRLGDAVSRFKECINAWIESTKRDRMNVFGWLNLGDGHRQIADIWLRMGRPQDALRALDTAMTGLRSMVQNASALQFQLSSLEKIALIQADLGDRAASTAALEEAMRVKDSRNRIDSAATFNQAYLLCRYEERAGQVAALNGDLAQAKSIARQAIARMAAAKPVGDGQLKRQNMCNFSLFSNLGAVEFEQGEYASAVQSLKSSLAHRSKNPPGDRLDEREQADVAITLALALSKLGNTAEANETLAPALALHRTLAKLNADDQYQHLQLAGALYAQAQANPAMQSTSLREAGTLIAALPPAMKSLRSVAIWTNRINLATRAAK